jgi:hypothetical protein
MWRYSLWAWAVSPIGYDHAEAMIRRKKGCEAEIFNLEFAINWLL